MEIKDIWRGWRRKAKESRRWFANNKPPQQYKNKGIFRKGSKSIDNTELNKRVSPDGKGLDQEWSVICEIL